jgi:iron complex transport system ATP-binding protein
MNATANESGAAFACESLSFTSPHSSTCAVCDVSVAIPHGSFCAVIGPNGSGKSTLVRLLLGAETPTTGRALFEGREVSASDRAELARTIGVVTQSEDLVFPISVRELVAMGRYPHLGSFRRESAKDRAAIDEALTYCSLSDLADRTMNTLSGGERQRARIARALAQQPRVLVLDEPTAALDIAHEMSIFGLLDRLTRESGVTVVLVTHNINLAARYATLLLLLDRGRLAAHGPAHEVITRARVQSTYHWPVAVQMHPGPGLDTGAPQVAPLRSSAEQHDTH